jgi:hypothetical protein
MQAREKLRSAKQILRRAADEAYTLPVLAVEISLAQVAAYAGVY